MKSFTILFLLFFDSLLMAQFSLSSQLSSYYTDNLYRSPQKTKDFVALIDFNLIYESPTWPLSLSIYPEFYTYMDHSDQNFVLGAASLEYFPFMDKNEKWQFYTSLYGSLRLDKDELKNYNYRQLQFLSGIDYNGNFALNQFFYQYQIREYPNFSALNNQSHYLNWKFNKSFKTRTTLITNLGFSSRKYESQNMFIWVADTLTNIGYKGRGLRGRPTRVIKSPLAPVELRHLSLTIRLAQNVLHNLGIAVQYLKSFDLSSSGDFQNYGSYLGDEELFDDPLSYLSNQWTTQFTWVLPGQWQVRFTTEFNRKDYIKERAYLSATDTSASGDRRKDRKLDMALTLGKSFFVQEKFTILFSGLIYYTDNYSNSFWYDYKNLVTGISLNLVY